MTARLRLIGLIAALAVTNGCTVVSAATSVATLPVRAASKAVDLATTSQSEADEKRGREIRKREERLGQLDRQYRTAAEDCAEGQPGACTKAEAIRAEMRTLIAESSYEPGR